MSCPVELSGDGFASLFEFLPIGAYRALPGGRLVRANPALVRMNGCASEQDLLEQADDRWYEEPGRRHRFAELLARDGRVDGFVSEVVGVGHGRRMWVSECAQAVRDADGALRYYEGTVEDITARVHAEHALQLSRERDATWKLALEATGDGVWDWHVQTGQELHSPRLLQMYGFEPGELATQALALDLRTHPDDVAQMQRAREAHFAGLAPVYMSEHRIRCRDGRWKWILSRGMVIFRDTEGRPLRMIGTHTDITERKLAEALRAERDRAEAASRAKTHFLSRVSHELRTPLNAILGFAQLLDMDPGMPPRQHAWVQAILTSGRHLLSLVDDVLDLSSAQTGQLRVDTDWVDLVHAAEAGWAMVAARAAQAEIRLDDRMDRSRSHLVRADPKRVRQVVSNLLSNAVKYNRPGGRVGLRLAPRAPGWLALEVHDTGPGLDEDQQARLFTPFDRLGAQRGTVEGTGLGLALCRQLAEAMGGRIEVASRPGEGSCFSLVLPEAAARPD